MHVDVVVLAPSAYVLRLLLCSTVAISFLVVTGVVADDDDDDEDDDEPPPPPLPLLCADAGIVRALADSRPCVSCETFAVDELIDSGTVNGDDVDSAGTEFIEFELIVILIPAKR